MNIIYFVLTIAVLFFAFYFYNNVLQRDYSPWNTKTRLVIKFYGSQSSKRYFVQMRFLRIWFTLRKSVIASAENSEERAFFDENEAVKFAQEYQFGIKNKVLRLVVK